MGGIATTTGAVLVVLAAGVLAVLAAGDLVVLVVRAVLVVLADLATADLADLAVLADLALADLAVLADTSAGAPNARGGGRPRRFAMDNSNSWLGYEIGVRPLGGVVPRSKNTL